MEELIRQVANLKESLNNTTEVKTIIELNKKLATSKELQEKINNYKERVNESLKTEICQDEFYQKYKVAETDLNILILKINKELKKINSKGKCNL